MLRDIHVVVDVVRVDSILVFKVNHNKIVKNHACLDDCLHHMTFSKTTSGGQDMELCLEHSKRSFNVLPLASCADANICFIKVWGFTNILTSNHSVDRFHHQANMRTDTHSPH